MEEDLIDLDFDELKGEALPLLATEENTLPSLTTTEHAQVTHVPSEDTDEPTLDEAMNEEAKHLDADNSSVSSEIYLDIDAPIPENPYRRLQLHHRDLRLLPTYFSYTLPRWRWRTIWLGWLRAMILVITTPILFAVFGQLTFLWLKRSEWRRKVILDDRVVAMVAKCSSALGATISIQAVVCFWLLGTLFSPISVFGLRGTPPPLDLRRRSILSLATCMLATSLGSLYISTLLDYDLGRMAIGRPMETPNANYDDGVATKLAEKIWAQRRADPNWKPVGFKPFNVRQTTWRTEEPDYSTVRPSSFPTFAEYTNATSKDTQPGVDDTGVVIRALLPISDSKTREKLWRHNGFAALFNSRVICVQPTVSKLYYAKFNEQPYLDGEIMMGNIRPKGLYHDTSRDPLKRTHFKSRIKFRCHQSESSGDEWPISLCPVGSTVDSTSYPESPTLFGLQMESPFETYRYSRPYVMMNFTGSKSKPPGDIGAKISFNQSHSPWTGIIWPTPEEEYSYLDLQFSLCFSNFVSADFEVEVLSPESVSSHARTEPTVATTDSGFATLHHHTSATNPAIGNLSSIITQLDTLSGNHSKRGILSITPQNPWIKPRHTHHYFSPVVDGMFGFLHHILPVSSHSNYFPHTHGLCTGCGEDLDLESIVVARNQTGVKRVDELLVTVFQDLLRRRGPAVALQGLFTMAARTQYYARLKRFDYDNFSCASLYEDHIGPVRVKGFLVVVALLAIHFVLTGTIVYLFLSEKKGEEFLTRQIGLTFGDNEKAKNEE